MNERAFLYRFFRWFCNPELYDELSGDLEESYYLNESRYGKRKARRIYLMEVVGMIRPSVVRKFKKNSKTKNYMTQQNFKLAFRNMKKDKWYTALNLFGLTIAFVASTIIFQYVNFESSYDYFHEGVENIYRVNSKAVTAESNETKINTANSYFGLKSAILAEVPEVAHCTHLATTNGTVTINNDLFTENSIYFTTSDFFRLFSFGVLSGDPSLLDQPNHVMISESTAGKYFGSGEAVGKSLIYDDGGYGFNATLTVAGVYADMPPNGQFAADLVMNIDDMERGINDNNLFGALTLNDVIWRWISFSTYIKISPEVEEDVVAQKIDAIVKKNRAPYDKAQGVINSINLQNIQNIHVSEGLGNELRSTVSPQTILILRMVGFGILFIALVNYVNIVSARILKRAKEIGVKKVLGSSKGQIRVQFVVESMLLVLLSATLSTLIILGILPFIDQYLEVAIFNSFLFHQSFWLVIALIILGGALVTGLYPSYVVSEFKIATIIKGKLSQSKTGYLIRKGLVAIQFSIAIVLISSIYIVYAQLHFMLTQDLGVDVSQTIYVDAPTNTQRADDHLTSMATFKKQLEADPKVSAVSISTIVPGEFNGFSSSIERGGPELKGNTQISRAFVDEEYLALYDIGLVAGEGFSKELQGNKRVMVINETAIPALGFADAKSALNQMVVFPGTPPLKIIGIMEDYHQTGLQSPMLPTAFNLDSTLSSNRVSIKLTQEADQETVAFLEEKYSSFFPGVPYEFQVLDEQIREQYDAERELGFMLLMFSSIAIIVAVLGLIGLTAYMISQKRKEISVRKVLGSNLSHLFMLINREYLVLASVAFAVSAPMSYFLTKRWLDDFAYHVTIEWSFFLVPLAAILIIIVLTTFKLVYDANNVNPAAILKDD